MELVVIFGPPAVGKMTVGHELCRLTGFRLSHNHLTVEPIKEIFAFGTPPFFRLVSEFRLRILEEAVRSDLPGLVQTFVWGFDLPGDAATIDAWAAIAADAGAGFRLVELYSDTATRLARNTTEFRQQQKRSHRDPETSTAIFHQLEAEHVMNSGTGPTPADETLARHHHVRIDNTSLSAAETAQRIVAELGL